MQWIEDNWEEHLSGFGYPEEGSRDLGSVEELYQAFKARLIRELMVDVHGTSHYGRLVAEEKSSR